MTHSSLGVACIILAESLPFLAWGLLRLRVNLDVGVRTLASLDLIRALLLLGLLVLPISGVTTKVIGVALVASIAFTTAIFEPAFRTLIPELVPGEGRQAYASFDLGGRLARIAGPLLAAVITWGGSSRGLLAADIVTFLVSAYCLPRITQPSPIGPPVRPPAQQEWRPGCLGWPASWSGRTGSAPSRSSSGGSHYRSQLPTTSTYSLCIGACAVGGITANLILSRNPDRHQPTVLTAIGWAVTALCIGTLTSNPDPLLLQGTSFICGLALASAALGFSYHAASLDMPERNRLFQRDQVVMRAAGAGGAVAGGVALEYSPHTALVATAVLLLCVAGVIWRSRAGDQCSQPIASLTTSSTSKYVRSSPANGQAISDQRLSRQVRHAAGVSLSLGVVAERVIHRFPDRPARRLHPELRFR